MAYLGRRKRSYASIAWVAVVVLFVVVSGGVYGTGMAVNRDNVMDQQMLIHEETGRLFNAAIDPRYQTKAEEINRVTTRLVVINAIRGGAIFDQSGHLQEVFGEKTDTSLEAIERSRNKVYAVEDPTRLELYYPPAATGTPFHILTRVETKPIFAQQELVHERLVFVALVAGTIAAVFGAAIIVLFVTIPVGRIVAVVTRALGDPAQADSGEPLKSGRTEIGILAGQIERFRTELGEIWRTKVLVADTLLESSPFGVVQLAADGSPAFANPAASALFGRDVVRTQSTVPLVVRDVATGTRQVLREHVEAYGLERRLVEIITSSGANYALMASLLIGVDTRKPTNLVLFADVGDLHRARLAADEQSGEASNKFQASMRREFELKLMLESCMALLGGTDKPADVQIEASPFATEWLTAAAGAGMISMVNTVAEGPVVAGGAVDLKASIRLGLLVAYARLGYAPASMSVEIRGINFETVGVTIKATPSSMETNVDSAVVADWQLAFAALRMAVRRIGGQLSDVVSSDGVVVVKIILRGAAERLQTGLRVAR